MKRSRSIGLDIIRVFAIFFVLSVHFFLNTNFYSTPLVGRSMYLQVFMRMTFIICVPLFIILTGYLQKNKKVSNSYFKKILPIITVYIFYSVIAIAFRILFLNEDKSILQWISSIENFSADNYSWYIEMYIGLFLISPFLNLIYNNLNCRKDKNILILILVFMTACPEFFNGKLNGLINFPGYWCDIYPIMYYFIGCYIREYKPRMRKLSLSGYLLMIIVIETVLEIYGAHGGKFSTYVGYYGSVIISVQAILFFILFYDVSIENRFCAKIIAVVSVLSLDIYLSSKITDTIVYKILFKYYFASQQSVVLLFLPTVLSTFTLAFIISYLRSKMIKLRENADINNQRYSNVEERKNIVNNY